MTVRHIATFHYRLANLNEGDPPSVLSLDGYRAFVKDFTDAGLTPPDLDRHGGATVAVVRNDSKKTYHIGVSICNTMDHYTKKSGTRLALQRAQDAASQGRKFGLPDIPVQSRKQKRLNQPVRKSEHLETILDAISADIPLRFLYDNDSLPNNTASVPALFTTIRSI